MVLDITINVNFPTTNSFTTDEDGNIRYLYSF